MSWLSVMCYTEVEVTANVKQRLNAYRTRTKRILSNLPANVVSTAYLVDLWFKQCGKCHYSGLDMTLGVGGLCEGNLDKIVPELGYVEGNVVWATQAMNFARNNAAYTEFVNFIIKLRTNE